MEIERWKSQLRKGAAELAVLSLLDQAPLSGIGLLDRLRVHREVGLSDGTIYPLLSRLERDQRIKGEWELPADGGRPSKLYHLTDEGRVALSAMRQAWIGFRDDLSDITGGKS